jgi:hypothetical protein
VLIRNARIQVAKPLSGAGSGRKPSVILPVAAAALLAAYVGVYYAMVQPVSENLETSTPCYGNNQPLEQFFAPVHWLDRHIRPSFWERTWEPELIEVHPPSWIGRVPSLE